MRAKLIGAVATAVIAVSLSSAGSASAATEFGDACFANDLAEQSVTLYEVFAPENPLPVTAPAAGVITKWRVNVIPAPVSIPQTLKVLHPVGPGSVQIVGEATQNVNGGGSTAETRIPVQAGDRLALFGPAEGLLNCELPAESAVIGGFLGPGGSVGATVSTIEEPAPIRVPVTGFLEPDADKDGFGDETQDKCPQSAAFQVVCPPVVTVQADTGKVGRGAVTVLVTTNTTAPVQVSGTVKLGKGKKATLKAPGQTVAGGQLAKFTLKFGGKLKTKLKELKPSKKLTLKITASATNPIGQVTTALLNAKLKGQAK
jgi:hypothetical protein